MCAASFPLNLGFFVKEGKCMKVGLRVVRGKPKARAMCVCVPLCTRNTMASKTKREKEMRLHSRRERERERERERDLASIRAWGRWGRILKHGGGDV